MNDEEYKCCDCPKYKAEKHESLTKFGNYGNNELMKQDAQNNNWRCDEHFLKKEAELSD